MNRKGQKLKVRLGKAQGMIIRKCPGCAAVLINELPPPSEAVSNNISYEALVSLVQEKGGELKIEMLTTDVEREKKWSFPYQGYGFGWANKAVLTLTIKTDNGKRTTDNGQ